MSEARKKKFTEARDIGVYASVPFMFLAGPALGYGIGLVLEKYWLQNPWGMLLGLLLGFGGTIKAMMDVLKKQAKMEEAKKLRKQADLERFLKEPAKEGKD